MKNKSILWSATRALFAASLAGLAGCANVPTQSPTTAYGDPARTNVQLPRPLHTVRPVYPVELRKAGVSGEVRVECLVDASGHVADTKVLSATSDLFIKPAVEAVKKWTFTPGMREGVPLAMRVSFPMTFALAP